LRTGLALEPLSGALAAGNAAVVKPSELAPATSAFLAANIPKYLDSKAVKVVEGGPDVGDKLMDHPWDKVLFTGNHLTTYKSPLNTYEYYYLHLLHERVYLI
jgi:aldehyde dehydrogenase (NAD+)